jgi:hypothetical protein
MSVQSQHWLDIEAGEFEGFMSCGDGVAFTYPRLLPCNQVSYVVHVTIYPKIPAISDIICNCIPVSSLFLNAFSPAFCGRGRFVNVIFA